MPAPKNPEAREEWIAKISKSKMGCPGYWKGKEKSEEHKEKIAKSLTGRKATEETKEKLRVHKKNGGSFQNGSVPWNKGLKASEEAKEKLSISHKGKPSGNKGKKLSQEQKENMRGENSYWWKGGISVDYGKKLSKREWKELVKAVRLRDGDTCQICGVTKEEKGRNMDVHHIIPWSDSNDDSLDNLICLCRSCHMKEERKLKRIGE